MMQMDDRNFADLVKMIDGLARTARETAQEDAADGQPRAALRSLQEADEYETILNGIAGAVGVRADGLLQGVQRWEAACEETIKREGYDLFDLTLGDAKLPSLMDSLQETK